MTESMHRFVVVGDSLSQGFMSGAIHRPDLSYPAIIARAIGVHDTFRYCEFDGADGLPLNLEALLHRLSRVYGSRIDWWDVVPAMASVRSILDDVEDYWERGRGTWPVPTRSVHHNLAVWGFEVGDATMVTEGVCRRAIPAPEDNLFKQVPEMPMYRTARRVLNPTFSHEGMEWSQMANVRELQAKGGIENLVVALGANNALGTVTSLELRYSEPSDLHRQPHERDCNLYLPEHFRIQYRALAEEVAAVGAERVFVATVPHVTVPPVTRGVSPDGSLDGGYFEFYTRPWIWDDVFDKDRHPHLTRAQARRIDEFIDEYNGVVAETAAEHGWHVFDLCRMLDDLAFRRRQGETVFDWPAGLAAALKRNRKLAYLVGEDGAPTLDTRFFMVKDGRSPKIVKGGLFSLDGIHPTTVGYGLVAHELLGCLRDAGADVPAGGLDVKTRGRRTLWDDVVAADTLIGDPPTLLDDLRDILVFLEKRGLFSELLAAFD